MLTIRHELHKIIESLSAEQLKEAKRALEQIARNHPRPSLEDVLAKSPIDDEPLTPEAEAAIERGFADF